MKTENFVGDMTEYIPTELQLVLHSIVQQPTNQEQQWTTTITRPTALIPKQITTIHHNANKNQLREHEKRTNQL